MVRQRVVGTSDCFSVDHVRLSIGRAQKMVSAPSPRDGLTVVLFALLFMCTLHKMF